MIIRKDGDFLFAATLVVTLVAHFHFSVARPDDSADGHDRRYSYTINHDDGDGGTQGKGVTRHHRHGMPRAPPGREFAIRIPVPVPIVIPVPASSLADAVADHHYEYRNSASTSYHQQPRQSPSASYQNNNNNNKKHNMVPVYRSKHILKPAKKKLMLKKHRHANDYNDDRKHGSPPEATVYDRDTEHDDGDDLSMVNFDHHRQHRHKSSASAKNSNKYRHPKGVSTVWFESSNEITAGATGNKPNHHPQDHHEKAYKPKHKTVHHHHHHHHHKHTNQNPTHKHHHNRHHQHHHQASQHNDQRLTPQWTHSSKINSIQDILATAKRRET